MTYANVEQRSLDFLVHCVQPWLRRLEDALSSLLPADQYVRFDTGALLRTDAETQAKVHIQLLAGKVVTPTEVRASYQMPPMTPDQQAEADMVPLTITPLGGAKALPAIKLPPGPAAPDPANDPQGASNAA
jgi:phage portal protein BeeE